MDNFREELIGQISQAYEDYLADIEKNSSIRKTNRKNIQEFREYKICPAYGLTPEEINFVKNYEVEFRVQEEK